MIETPRTTLRPLEPEDLDQLYLYRNDPEVMHWLGGFSAGYSHADLEQWLISHRNRRDEVLWAVASRPEDRCIGHVGLYQIDHRSRKAEFAILIGDADQQGKGIGKEVTKAVLAYGFDELNLHRITLSAIATNDRAIHLYASLGFTQEGLLREDVFREGRYIDVVLMAILEDEWRYR